MPSHDAPAFGRGLVVPPCQNCQQSDQVRPIALHDLSPGIQYYRCDACGYVWATQDGLELRTLRRA
jgi:hypothetical protein